MYRQPRHQPDQGGKRVAAAVSTGGPPSAEAASRYRRRPPRCVRRLGEVTRRGKPERAVGSRAAQPPRPFPSITVHRHLLQSCYRIRPPLTAYGYRAITKSSRHHHRAAPAPNFMTKPRRSRRSPRRGRCGRATVKRTREPSSPLRPLQSKEGRQSGLKRFAGDALGHHRRRGCHVAGPAAALAASRSRCRRRSLTAIPGTPGRCWRVLHRLNRAHVMSPAGCLRFLPHRPTRAGTEGPRPAQLDTGCAKALPGVAFPDASHLVWLCSRGGSGKTTIGLKYTY